MCWFPSATSANFLKTRSSLINEYRKNRFSVYLFVCLFVCLFNVLKKIEMSVNVLKRVSAMGSWALSYKVANFFLYPILLCYYYQQHSGMLCQNILWQCHRNVKCLFEFTAQFFFFFFCQIQKSITFWMPFLWMLMLMLSVC